MFKLAKLVGLGQGWVCFSSEVGFLFGGNWLKPGLVMGTFIGRSWFVGIAVELRKKRCCQRYPGGKWVIGKLLRKRGRWHPAGNSHTPRGVGGVDVKVLAHKVTLHKYICKYIIYKYIVR